MFFFSKLDLYVIIIYHLIIPSQECDTNGTLKLVHVVFRHGSRTQTERNGYPTDPHKNQSYYPYGMSQLTNKGKLQEYQIGQALRKRYNSFLGDLYTTDMLDATTSQTDRTKMSMQLVLAGLFPPANTLLEWNKFLNWQPIPYNEVSESTNLLGINLWNCPNYVKAFGDFLNSPLGLETKRPYQKLFDYVNEHSGLNVTSNGGLLSLYNTLEAQFDFGLELPSWTTKIHPNKLSKAAGTTYVQMTYTKELRQLSGGFLLKKIIQDSIAKMKGKLILEKRKIFLYAGHDSTIGNTLATMGLMHPPHQPPFAAYILIELHEIDNVYGFKIVYENYTFKEPHYLTIPRCGEFCPIDKFIELFDKYLPVEENPCDSSVENDAHVISDVHRNELRDLLLA